MDDLARIADALVKNQFVTWRQAMITGVVLAASIFGGLGFMLSTHSGQVHANAVTQAEFDRTLRAISVDVGEIRNDIRELRKGG